MTVKPPRSPRSDYRVGGGGVSSIEDISRICDRQAGRRQTGGMFGILPDTPQPYMPRRNPIAVSIATVADAPEVVDLATRVAEDLTQRHGKGHWSSCPTDKGVLRKILTTWLLVARLGNETVGMVLLQSKKPWAIDVTYFTGVERALYLLDLAVAPPFQGKGIGRLLINQAIAAARAWPSNAIRLDAYDHLAGAGPFNLKCGFREVGRVVYRGVPLVYFETVF